MNGWIDFAASWWWFPLLVAPGLWLSARLYVYGPAPHKPLAFLYGGAWLLLALWVVSPTWKSRPEIWHPPLVILAVDASPGFAALGARDSGLAARQSARAHYESLGFRVVETEFTGEFPGGAAHPNLQAVLLWSDGRFSRAETGHASVPVFPVWTEVATGEVQGESAFVAITDEGLREAGTLTVAWRALGLRGVDARAELRAEDVVVWSGVLKHPSTVRAGERATTVIPLSAQALEAAGRDGEEFVLLVRPDEARANAFAANDTVKVDASRIRRAVQAFVRPVATLQERGLMDALREESSFRVMAMSGTAARTRAMAGHAVIWVSAGREEFIPALRMSDGETDAKEPPMIAYRLMSHQTSRPAAARTHGVFGPDARIERVPGIAPFLPAGALRLADLGFADSGRGGGGWALVLQDEGKQPLAWAVQDGHRGLLFWRDGNRGAFGFVVPPIWSVRFQPGTATPAASASLASAWVRGAAAWALAGHPSGIADSSTVRSTTSAWSNSADSGNPLARLGIDTEALARLAARTGGRVLNTQDGMATDFEWPDLSGGQIRETRTRSLSLAPPVPAALAVALLLAGVWVWRKRRQLD